MPMKISNIKEELITDFREDTAIAKLRQSAEKKSNSHVNSASSSSPIIFNSAQNSSKLISCGILMQSKIRPANGLSQTLQHVNKATGTKSKPRSIGFEYPKPAYSYSCLNAIALKNSRSGCLPVSEIYSFMCEHFPYFKTAPISWKNCVRHNLSLTDYFEKNPSARHQRRFLWSIKPNKISEVDEVVQKWSRKNHWAIRKAMVYPENLEALERGEMKHGSTEDSDNENDMESESDMKDSISEPCSDNELDDMDIEELQEYEEDSEEEEVDVEDSSGPILDHYISDSMQEMLDIDIKAEVATVVGGTNEFSSLINNLPSLDIESSYTDVCGDISWLGAPKWSSNDLYADVGACVNPNSVTPIISSSFLNASKAHLNLNTTYYRRSNSPPPSPKENKSHLTFSPHQIKVSSVQEPKRSSLLAVSNKPLVDAIKKELITDFKEDNAVAKNLPSANTIKLAPGIGGLTFANSVAYTKLKQSAVKTQVSPTVFTNVVIQNEKESNSHVNASSVSSASSSSPIIFNSAQNSSKLVSRGILMQSKSLPANGLSQTLQHVNTASGTKSKPKSIGFEYPKPAYSYSCLIAMALKNSRSGSLPVSEIYSFMCEHFPYFKTAPSAWKNSVRHNLSLNKCFEKIEKPATNGGQRKGCLWAMNPNKISKMDEEVQKWSRKNPMAIRKAMVYPENLEALERGEMKHGSTGDSDGENDMQSDTKDNSISEQDNELDDTILDIKEELQEYEEDSDDGEKEFDVEVSDLYDSVEVENRKDKISMTIQRSDVLEFTENDYIPPKRARLDINYSIGPAGAFGHQLQQQQQQQHQPTQSHSRRKMQLVNRII